MGPRPEEFYVYLEEVRGMRVLVDLFSQPLTKVDLYRGKELPWVPVLFFGSKSKER